MIDRLIAFYKHRRYGAENMMSDIWRDAIALQKPLSEALNTGSADEVKRVLSSIGTGDGISGLENRKVYPFADSVALPYFERLAHCAGVLPFCNQNQLSPGQDFKVSNIEATKVAIETQLGFQMSVPDCFGFSGSNGVPIRFLIYYWAAALSILRRWRGTVPARILEIGAGLGQLGLFAWRWHSKSYTVIDLPQVAVLSAHFMSKVCGESKVWLFGEPADDKAFARFFPCTDFSDAGSSRYDLAFNCDSLPEIPVAVQDAYLNLIADCLAPNGVFLSINHESNRGGQSSVLDAVKRNGNRLKLVSRHPFTTNDGYVEEIYQL